MTSLTAEITWLWWLLEDFGVSVSALTPLLSDSTGVISIGRDPVKHELTMHIGVDASYMRSQMQDKVIAFQYVPSELQLADFFTKVVYDRMTGRSRGFGFVTMSTAEEVGAAVEQFNGYTIQGRPLRVNSGPPPPRDEFASRGPRGGSSFDSSNRGGPRGGGSFDSPNKVYVGNLSWGVDNSTLENLFSEQGKVIDAKVIYDRESGRSRGFGFVTYGSAEDVTSAISNLDGIDLDGRQIRVTVAESKPRRQF